MCRVPIMKCQSRSANHEADTVRPTKCPKVHCLVMWVQKAYKSRRVRAMAAQPLHPFCPVALLGGSNKPTDSECNRQRITSTFAPEGSNMSKSSNAKTCIPRLGALVTPMFQHPPPPACHAEQHCVEYDWCACIWYQQPHGM